LLYCGEFYIFAALTSNLKSGVAFGAALHRDLVLFCAKLVQCGYLTQIIHSAIVIQCGAGRCNAMLWTVKWDLKSVERTDIGSSPFPECKIRPSIWFEAMKEGFRWRYQAARVTHRGMFYVRLLAMLGNRLTDTTLFLVFNAS
jgi:hypothetical protein